MCVIFDVLGKLGPIAGKIAGTLRLVVARCS